MDESKERGQAKTEEPFSLNILLVVFTQDFKFKTMVQSVDEKVKKN